MDQHLGTIDPGDFDEAQYLERYPDIAAAVAEGRVASGWVHFNAHGRAEGRQGGIAFDPDFYLRSYPIAVREIAAGAARDALDHYRTRGRGRGFLPGPTAPRPDDAAAPPRFGGFWTDRPDALDLVEGRLELGRITADEAERLRCWIRNGYVVLPRAVARAVVDRVVRDVDRAYAGGFDELLFECHSLRPGYTGWDRRLDAHPSKAVDLHHFSACVREAMFARPITAFLGLLCDSKLLATQSLAFWRGSAQEGHQDSAYVAYTVARQFAASWIALEDVTIGAGELFYYEGSHRFADFLYANRYKSVSEAERHDATQRLPEEIRVHIGTLEDRVRAHGLRKSVFAARKGDALVWHADLVHGGNPISSTVTCKSLVTHYCPKRLAPLFAERVPTQLWEHDGHVCTTSHYGRTRR